MDISSLGLIFLCGFFWSVFDLSRKRLGHALPVIQALFLFMWAQIPIFLVGAIWTGAYEIKADYWKFGVLGIGINFLGNALFIASISRASLGHTVPMLSFSCVVSALVSYFVLDEVLIFQQVIGIFLITLGAFLLNGLPSLKKSETAGAWLMGLAAVFWGTMASLDKLCLELVHPTLHAAIQTTGIGILATIILIKKGEFKVTLQNAKSQIFNLGLGTFGSSAAILSQLYVIQSVAVGLFEAIKRVFAMLLSMMWGRLLYNERLTKAKLLSLILMGLGLVLLLVTPAARAETSRWDSSLDLGLRSFPLGAAIGLEAGQSRVLWGKERIGQEGEFQYGYVRAGARIQTSGLVNRLEGKISVFPISLWGLELSSALSHRALDSITPLDCLSLSCDGSLRRTRLMSPLYLGIEAFFARLRVSYQWVERTKVSRDLAGDESINLPIRSSGDRILSSDALLGYAFTQYKKLMLFAETHKTRHTQENSFLWGLMGQWNFEELPSQNFYMGLGLYDSSLLRPHGQLFFAYSWTFQKAPGF
jgi:drug/metabolite transporter (DMT)-like permease